MRPTEDVERVKRAVANIFVLESTRVVEAGEYQVVVGESSSIASLLRFREFIRRERIADTARRVMSKQSTESLVSFMLNKQAAYSGRLSFVEHDSESSLGPIKVFIEVRSARELFNWLFSPKHVDVPRDL